MMQENVPKGFRVPKIRRQENKDNLRQVEVTSRDAKEIVNIVNHSYLDNNYTPAWELKSVHLIENRDLEEKYRQKKLSMKDGQKRETLPEQFAFQLIREDSSIPSIVKNGMKVGNISHNSLGDSKMGVYVFKNADIQLKMAELWNINSCTVLVFKVTLGKCKALPTQIGDELIEPTPNYDCHIHQSQPKIVNPLHIQLARSQIYLYEYTDDCEPAEYPRQCLPYAILRYEKTESSTHQAPLDSYSRRTVKAPDSSRQESSRQESTESSSSQKPEPKTRLRDPRKPATDPRLAYQQLDDSSGLCVPRLTGGPSIAESQTKVIIPPTTDIKITHSGDPKLVLQQLQKDPRIAKNNKDPRLVAQGPPSDPRLIAGHIPQIDPRVATSQIPQIDPRLAPSQIPPNYPNIPPPINPMMNLGIVPPNDSRLTGALPPGAHGHVEPNGSYLPSFGPTEEELQNKRLEILMQVQSSLPPHARKDPRMQADDKDSRRRDPRLQKQEDQRPKDPRQQDNQSEDTFRKNSHSEERQRARKHSKSSGDKEKKKMSLHEYKKKVSIQPPVKPESSSLYTQPSMSEVGGQQYQPDGSAFNIDPSSSTSQPESRAPERMGINPSDHDDIVHRPDDMARTLNELSDPDDHISSTEEQDQEEEDPALAEAMKKLVEYASDVPLFTEALRTLQESAEQYGDSLTNPVFLVKKIAEYIDQLAKDTNVVTEKPEVDSTVKSDTEVSKSVQDGAAVSDAIQPIQSPEDMDISSDHEDVTIADDNQSIKSPDAADTSIEDKDNVSTTVREIPLENTEQGSHQGDLSPMSKAMRKTLEEYSLDLNQSLPKQKLFTDEKLAFDEESKKAVHSLDLDSIPLPTLPNKNVPEKQTDKKRISPKLGISFNLKKRTISPVNVPNVFSDLESGDMLDKDERRVKRHKSGDIRQNDKNSQKQPWGQEMDIDLRRQDRDFRKSGPHLDSDLRKQSNLKPKGDKPASKGYISKSQSSVDVFETQDRDERVSQVNVHKSLSAGTLDPSMLDRDDRMSNSRSGSPQLNSAFMDVDERSSSQQMSECFRNIQDDTDNRDHSRSQSPTIHPDINKQSQDNKVRFDNTVTDSQSSEDTTTLFDAYGVKKEQNPVEARTDFGDVDWRLAEAQQMGDVDLRAVPAKVAHSSGDVDLRGPFAKVQSFLSLHTTPSTQSHYTEQYRTAPAKIDSYSTSKPAYEAYSTSKDPLPSYSTVEGYKTSGSVTQAHSTPSVVPGGIYPQSYSTSSPQTDSPGSGHLKNLMHNLDLSNLKNILANVQQPQTAAYSSSQESDPSSQTIPGLGGEEEEEEENKPAFCTGLSFLKSKQPKMDKDRSKYSGIAKTPFDVGPPQIEPPVQLPSIKPFTISPIKSKVLSSSTPPSLLDIPLPVEQTTDTEPPQQTLRSLFDIPMFGSSSPKGNKANVIPGFENPTDTEHFDKTSPVKDDKPLTSSPAKSEKTKTPFKFSEEIPDRDFSSEWYEEPKPVQKHGKSSKSEKRKLSWDSDTDSKVHKTKGDRTPTKKRHSKKVVTASSWQTAILESMEEYELKVKSDDSIDIESDKPASPVKDVGGDEVSPKKDSSAAEADNKDKLETVKAEKDSDKEETKLKPSESNEKKNAAVEEMSDQDSDDDEEALVIDLNADTSMVKDTSVLVENTEKPGTPVQDEPMMEEDNSTIVTDGQKVKRTDREKEDGDLIFVSKEPGTEVSYPDDKLKRPGTPVQDEPKIEEDAQATVTDGQKVDSADREKEDGDLIFVSKEPGTKTEDDGTDLEDEHEAMLEDQETTPTKSDDVKSRLEKTRKKMVIRLKGETKIVNPKTGKAYNESPVGSAIQVLGQLPKPSPAKADVAPSAPSPTFNIHPIHGIVSSANQPNPVKNTTNVVTNVLRRSHSPVFANVSVISTVVCGASGFRSTSPVNLMSPFGTAQTMTYREYIHPATGQKIQYGTPLSQQLPPQMSVMPQPMLVPGHGQIHAPIPVVPNPAIKGSNCIIPPGTGGMIQLPPFMGAVMPMGPISPVGVPPHSVGRQTPPPPGVGIQTLGNTNQPPPTVSSIQTLVNTAHPPPHLTNYKHIVNTAQPPPTLSNLKQVVNTAKPPPTCQNLQVKPVVNTSQPPPHLQNLQVKPVVNAAQPPPPLQNLPVKTVVNTAQPPPSLQNIPVKPIVNTAQPPPQLTSFKPVVNTGKPPPVLSSVQTSSSTSQPLSSQGNTNVDKKNSSDVYGWFSDKFEKRPDEKISAFRTVVSIELGEPKTKSEITPNYELSHSSANKVIKTVPESNLQHIDTSAKETESTTSGRERSNSSSKPVGKGNLISITTTENIPIDTSKSDIKTEVPSVLISNLDVSKKDQDLKAVESDASSELEDGEISDESADEPSPVKYDPHDHRQVVVQHRSSIPVLGSSSDSYPHQSGSYPRHVQRVPLTGQNYPDSPKRIVNVRSGPSGYMPVLEIKKDIGYDRGRRAAAEWSDMLQYPQHNPIETVKGNPPDSQAMGYKDQDDASTLLSKSAASINKNKQLFVARSQVKTLGDWLQVELETDNIQPLQSIIPYPLDTDLSIIPRARRRKIRIKVKNAIEQESKKTLNTEVQQPPQVSPVNRQTVDPGYIPEVDHDQIEKELGLISKTLVKARAQRDTNLQLRGNVNINLVGNSPHEQLIIALSTIENEMKTILHRTCFYGYPHRRVPAELLLRSEMQSFRSQVTDVFLILMMPISTKPYHKLLQMRRELENLHQDLLKVTDKASIQEKINNIHSQRQAILRSFTGYLNKRRIQKIQDNVDKYTQVYEFFKHQQPPVPDSLLKYIRTTQMDLRQHLILAKQYFAMEEKGKTNV